MSNTAELILKLTGDRKQLEQTLVAVRQDLAKSGQAQVTVTRETNRQVLSEARNQTRQLGKEETDRTRIAEQAAKNRSVVLIAQWKKEAQERKRIADEAEKGAGGGGINVEGLANQIPIVGRLTSQFTSLGAEVGGATTALGGFAVGAAAAFAGAAIGVGVIAKLAVEFFNLTKQTADFEGKFLDLSQQVGVSVETLSILDVMAQRTGGNIETVSAAMAIFQKHLEASHDPTSKESKLLKELGVTTLDTEGALRQTLKGLFDLGEGSKQTDAVLQLFGRSGRFVNAILKESKGDLDEAAKGMRGMLVTNEAAIAADGFNDSLGDLQRALFGVTRMLTQDSIPVFTLFFQEIEIALVGSASGWQSWGREIADVITFVIANVKALAQFVAAQGTISFDTLLRANFEALLKQADKLRADNQIKAQIDFAQRLAAAVGAGKPGDRPDTDKAAKEAQAREARALSLSERINAEDTKAALDKLSADRDKDLISVEEWRDQSITILADAAHEYGRIYDAQAELARRSIKNKDDLRIEETEIARRRNKALNDALKEIDKIKDEADKRQAQSSLVLNEQLKRIRDAERAEERRQIDRDLQLGLTTEAEAIDKRIELLTQEYEDRKILRQIELDAATTTGARRTALLNEAIEDERRYTTDYKKLVNERIDARIREGLRPGVAPREIKFPEPPPDATGANKTAGTPPLPPFDKTRSSIDQLFETIGTVFSGDKKTAAIAGLEALSGAFQGLADAAGNAVEAFVLYGNAGTSVRKVTAQIIAGVARQAAVKAVYELAEGLAALALAFFGMPNAGPAASAHFAAAAIYGSIAGIAALAGRAIAGNEFNKQGQSTGGSASSSSGSRSSNSTATTSDTEPRPVDLDRSVRGSQGAVRVDITIRRDPGSIVDAVVQNHRSNGDIRRMIQSEIAA